MMIITREQDCSVFNDSFFTSPNRKGYSVALNAEKLIRLNDCKAFRQAVSSATFLVVDGAAAKIWLRRHYNVTSEKVNFPVSMFVKANTFGLSVGVFGGTPLAAGENRIKLVDRFPNAEFKFCESGYQTLELMVERLNKEPVQTCFLALGSPKQEYFADILSVRFPKTFFVCCGGAIDVIAGRAQRAPDFIVNSNFEWLYRLWKDPSRYRRYVKLAKFLKVYLHPVILVTWLKESHTRDF